MAQLINKTEESIEETFKTLGIYEETFWDKNELGKNSGNVFREMASKKPEI